MAVSRALRRLLRVLAIEEEQRRLELESGLGELARLQRALTATAERDRGGRRMVAESASTGKLQDRVAGLEETRAAERLALVLKPRIAGMESEVTALRREFLAKRIERRQAETLVERAEAREAMEEQRRSQRMLDDRYLSRLQGAEGDAAAVPSEASADEGGTASHAPGTGKPGEARPM